jgi:hypothetical protein
MSWVAKMQERELLMRDKRISKLRQSLIRTAEILGVVVSDHASDEALGRKVEKAAKSKISVSAF